MSVTDVRPGLIGEATTAAERFSDVTVELTATELGVGPLSLLERMAIAGLLNGRRPGSVEDTDLRWGIVQAGHYRNMGYEVHTRHLELRGLWRSMMPSD